MQFSHQHKQNQFSSNRQGIYSVSTQLWAVFSRHFIDPRIRLAEYCRLSFYRKVSDRGLQLDRAMTTVPNTGRTFRCQKIPSLFHQNSNCICAAIIMESVSACDSIALLYLQCDRLEDSFVCMHGVLDITMLSISILKIFFIWHSGTLRNRCSLMPVNPPRKFNVVRMSTASRVLCETVNDFHSVKDSISKATVITNLELHV